MAKKKTIAKQKRQSLVKGQADLKQPIVKGQSELRDPKGKELILFNFKHYDPSQGQTFADWEKDGILSRALEKLKEYSKLTRQEAEGSKFKTYPSFPPPKKTKFKHPKHVPLDAEWASMHITGKQCVIGHFILHVFMVVFLDKEHEFYISKKKHT